MKLRHHAPTTISVTAGRWLDTVLCLNIAGLGKIHSKNWVKMEKLKMEFRNLRFKKANRNNIFDLRRQGGYIKVSSLRHSILNWILKII